MKKLICVILSIMLAALCLAGCNSGSSSGESAEDSADLTTPLSLVLIVGAHKNFPAITFTSEKLSDSIYTACRTYGEINVIVSEGVPEIKSNIKLESPGKGIDKKKHEQIAQSNSQSVKNLLPALKAETEQVDLLKSLELAADVLAASSSSRRELYVYDSGFCTAGVLSQLTDDYIGADHGEVAEKLSLMGALPDLTGVKVYWQGIGCASNGQSVPSSVKKAVKDMWDVILKKAGAEVVFDTTPVTGEEGTDLPDVAVLDFPEDKLILDDNTVIKFDEQTIKFKADSAEFIDEAGARDALKPVAALLMENPSLTVYIAGTTATVGVTEETPVTGIELSLDRAEACRDILVGMGVSSSQLLCKGLGCADNVLKTKDRDENGELIEEKAALNRAIYIFTVTSDTASQLGLS